MPRVGRFLRGLVSLGCPGLGQAIAGRRSSLAFAAAGASALAAGALGSAVAGCVCGLVAGGIGFAAVGLLAAVRSARIPEPAARGFGAGLLAAIALATPLVTGALLRAAVLDIFYVPSDSMLPTLRAGDYILVSRLVRAPHRGDLVVFRGERGGLFVKRVAALPGDRVEVTHGELTIDGRRAPLFLDPDRDSPLDARYYTQTGSRRHRVLFQDPWLWRPSFSERAVPPGHLFVLGDNRDRSEDSRRFGFVSLDRVVGRAFSVGPSRAVGGALSWRRAGTLL
jgi:signal peptidase I